MARIALAPDVASHVGNFAEKVENRSLLLDKFIFHKSWPVEDDERGKPVKWDDASRWSFMRLADDGSTLLKAEAQKLERDADGRNIEPDNRDRKLAQAHIAEKLSHISPPSRDIAELRAQHTRRFLALFQSGPPGHHHIIIGKLEARLAINLADGLIQNANICLDRVFGLPYIPGSAVKGVCRHAALDELKQASGEERRRLFDRILRIFGSTENDFSPRESASSMRKEKPAGALYPHLDLIGKPCDLKGAVTFLPAWPTDSAKIVVDLTNVHTPEYYQKGEREKLASEKPRLNSFPAVEAGARFAFALTLNGMSDDPALLTQASIWLRNALTIRGMGAKTSAGYGWFSIDDAALDEMSSSIQRDEAKVAREAAEQAQADAEARRLAELPPEVREKEELLLLNDEQFANFVKSLSTKTELQQKACIDLLRENKPKRERWKLWKKNGKKDLTTPILEVIETLKLPPLP